MPAFSTSTEKRRLQLVGSQTQTAHRPIANHKHNWRDCIVLPEMPIRQALNVLEQSSLRILLVVDRDCTLAGVVTDGDIRRGLIAGVSLETPIDQVMNKRPITANKNTPKDKLIDTMSRLDLLAIPLLDHGKIVGLQTLNNVLLKPDYQNPVFIMAGGCGTRLRPLTNDCPKPLLNVGDRPLLERTLTSFAKAGFCNFYISTHYIPEQIVDYFGNGDNWGVNISYIHEDEPLGTAGALGLLPQSMPKLPIIVMNGDILTNIDFTELLDFHQSEKAQATICVREYQYQIPYGVIQSQAGRVLEMSEKPVYQHHINAGIYVIDPDVAHSVRKNQKIDMPMLLESQLVSRRKVSVFPIQDYWLDIGSMDDFSRAQIDVQSLNL